MPSVLRRAIGLLLCVAGAAQAQLVSPDEMARQAREETRRIKLEKYASYVGKTYWIDLSTVQRPLGIRHPFYTRYHQDSLCTNLKYQDRVFPTKSLSFTVLELMRMPGRDLICLFYRVRTASGDEVYFPAPFVDDISDSYADLKSPYKEPILPVPPEEILAAEEVRAKAEAEERQRKEQEEARKRELAQRERERIEEEDYKAYMKLPLPRVGMTGEQVRNSRWRWPDDTYTLTVKGKVREKWTYPDGFVLFENGKVIAIQQHRR